MFRPNFIMVSDAFVVVPGGIGTVLETMMIWQLLQVRRMNECPLILVGPMWQGLIEWSRSAMLRPEFPLASPEDFEIPLCVTDGQAAIDQLRAHHAAWQATANA
ncbi:putative lysine decarboxylase [Caulifigura coniformis]|uniref:AMP nucleosidase n=1 Tax=Caulifigura coniformis TaxID=2527983 RepID=A0A517SLQ9_9PLAN|nr:LOG family protein [Caulifigura coniformis]QDT57054.1 putative lysine decarboxylase [Caulifigura coniformis]